MRRAVIALVAAAAWAFGCGPAGASGPQLPVNLLVGAAFPLTQLAGFQVTLLSNGTAYDCAVVQNECLKPNVLASAPVIPVTDAAGKTHPALFFPLQWRGGTPGIQDATVGGIPVGRDYALVIEAVSNDASPVLLGSSCNHLQPIHAGVNDPVVANPINANTVPCNPRFE